MTISSIESRALVEPGLILGSKPVGRIARPNFLSSRSIFYLFRGDGHNHGHEPGEDQGGISAFPIATLGQCGLFVGSQALGSGTGPFHDDPLDCISVFMRFKIVALSGNTSLLILGDSGDKYLEFAVKQAAKSITINFDNGALKTHSFDDNSFIVGKTVNVGMTAGGTDVSYFCEGFPDGHDTNSAPSGGQTGDSTINTDGAFAFEYLVIDRVQWPIAKAKAFLRNPYSFLRPAGFPDYLSLGVAGSGGEVGSISEDAALAAAFGAIASAAGDISEPLSLASQYTAVGHAYGAVMAALTAGDADTRIMGVARSIAANAQLSEVNAALVQAAAAVTAAASLGESWVGETQGAQAASIAAASDLGAAYVAAAQTVADIVDGMTLQDAVIGISVALASISETLNLGEAFAGDAEFMGSVFENLNLGEVFTGAITPGGSGVTEAAIIEAIVSGAAFAAIAAAEVSFTENVGLGATFSAGDVIAHLIAGAITLQAALLSTPSMHQKIAGVPDIKPN